MYGFMLHTRLLSQQIPNNTVYRWMVINHSDGTVMESITSTERSFCTIFARTGSYEIMVQAWSIQNQALLLNATSTIIIIES